MFLIGIALLTLVPSPIGNLQDITLRALDVLREADIVLAEDTRTSRTLLLHHGIDKKLFAHHQHNEHQAVSEIVRLIQEGNKIAMLSDAGTPGISDPGFLLVRECIQAGVEVRCLPGPTAFVPALIMSGLPCDRFVFEGFLPQKKGRQSRWIGLRDEIRTMVFYESPFRLVRFLEEGVEHLGAERKASVSREISKVYEETVRGSLESLLIHFREKGVKGEIVLVVGGQPTA